MLGVLCVSAVKVLRVQHDLAERLAVFHVFVGGADRSRPDVAWRISFLHRQRAELLFLQTEEVPR
jgi:hypothetical protein